MTFTKKNIAIKMTFKDVVIFCEYNPKNELVIKKMEFRKDETKTELQ